MPECHVGIEKVLHYTTMTSWIILQPHVQLADTCPFDNWKPLSIPSRSELTVPAFPLLVILILTGSLPSLLIAAVLAPDPRMRLTVSCEVYVPGPLKERIPIRNLY